MYFTKNMVVILPNIKNEHNKGNNNFKYGRYSTIYSIN